MGDYSKARAAFGWRPKTSFQELVRLMVDSDRKLAEEEQLLSERSGTQTVTAAKMATKTWAGV
jgi:hypothetical protein